QQAILDGIKGRLTSPLRLPYNFIKGPFIGWNAPKAIVSSMGAWTMPQLVFAAIIGFNKDSRAEALEHDGGRQPDHPQGRVPARGEEAPRRRPPARARLLAAELRRRAGDAPPPRPRG